MNPAVWLARTAQAQPHATALVKGTITDADYATFAHRSAAIGAALSERGIAKGERVAVFMHNCTEYLEVLYGIWWIGAVAVPINAKLHEKEAAWIIANSGAALVFADEGRAKALSGEVSVDILRAPGFDHDRIYKHRATRSTHPVSLSAQDTAWLFYTSGTTGRPKGVMISCGNLMSMTLSYFADVDDVTPADATLYAAPMSHGAGIYNFMHVLRGARHVVPESGGFDADEILELAPQIGRVSMFAAPTMVRRLVDRARAHGADGTGLRTIIYAGGPMYEADIVEAVAVMGPRFVQVYGQGECPMGITALSRFDIADRDHPRWRERLNSVGRAQSPVEVAILGPDGHALDADTVGEIAVRGATVMPGYWQNPEATADTLRNGWLWTGDMGRMDADGYVTLQDRSKDMIISGGSNIYPREVEEVLLSHPAVYEVAVVGQTDPEWGEVPVAFVALSPGQVVQAETLDRLCLDQIARFKRPRAYRFIPALPKNNYGKILKTDLRDMLQADPANHKARKPGP